ncbi:zinc finger protein 311-like [Frankliniella occidentalis]|uniref:Zinc finger protein 311-like n=1 Tax=Frankliniella occidentalis TaxID=133901 RepID=A0A9C6XUN6_FRAOC|nr:zinc finger protein 311-like [Frankliniella occidentalis]
MKCNWCGEQCGDADGLLAHIIQRHAPKPDVSVAWCSKPNTHKPRTDTQAVFDCTTCSKTFKHKRSLKRHEQEVHSNKLHTCETCKKYFKNVRSLKEHIKKLKHTSKPNPVVKPQPVPKNYKCRQCKEKFKTLFLLYSHKRSCNSPKYDKYVCDGCWRRFSTSSSLRYHVNGCNDRKRKVERARKVHELCSSKSHVGGDWSTESAVGGDARIHNLIITDLHDLQLTLLKNKDSIKCTVQKDLQELRRIKWYLSAFIRCQKAGEVEPENAVRYMRCSPLTTLQDAELNEQIQEAILGVINSFDKAQGEGSQILFEKVEKIELRVAKYSPLKGSSYMPLPKKFQSPTKGLVNIKNFDNKCFLYCCLAGVKLPARHPEKVSCYRHRLNEFNMQGITREI